MKIRVICVGKLKEKFFKSACEEYLKRLSAYAKVEIIELKDEKVPESYSEEEIRRVKEREGQKILEKAGTYPSIALDPNGQEMISEKFADTLEQMMLSGDSTINFMIGGSNGLSEAVLQQSRMVLSFSQMTFPHQLFRVMLLEQIYRAFKIIRNETYHK
ncbi:MAG: 23S rRNA (pseudouridine(1915)-N(3))-methyltransferase RlmH [Eubacteriaceae bacterium]|jgi:23S rRNA (pseudouridine1915-N3)-methyltransferase